MRLIFLYYINFLFINTITAWGQSIAFDDHNVENEKTISKLGTTNSLELSSQLDVVDFSSSNLPIIVINTNGQNIPD